MTEQQNQKAEKILSQIRARQNKGPLWEGTEAWNSVIHTNDQTETEPAPLKHKDEVEFRKKFVSHVNDEPVNPVSGFTDQEFLDHLKDSFDGTSVNVNHNVNSQRLRDMLKKLK